MGLVLARERLRVRPTSSLLRPALFVRSARLSRRRSLTDIEGVKGWSSSKEVGEEDGGELEEEEGVRSIGRTRKEWGRGGDDGEVN